MPDEEEKSSWWKSLPGVLTAVGGIILAVASLVVALHTAGVIGRDASATGREEPAKPSVPSDPLPISAPPTEPIEPCQVILFAAKDHDVGKNIVVGLLGYGEVITNNSGIDQENMVEFRFYSPRRCSYILEVEYAAEESRPVDILLNGALVVRGALRDTTGGWYPQHQDWNTEATFQSAPGTNRLRLTRASSFPHIRALRLIPQL